jgi:hypothetical protein
MFTDDLLLTPLVNPLRGTCADTDLGRRAELGLA